MLLADIGRTNIMGVDLLGHGSAPKPHEPEAYGDLGSRIFDAIEGEEPVDAVGFSLGAMTLLHAATQRPERFNRIVLSGIGNGLLAGADPSESAERANQIEAAMQGTGDLTNNWAQTMARYGSAPGNDPDALVACLRRPMPADPVTVQTCALVTCPVLVCIGDRDFAGPAGELAAAFPNATHKVLRNTDHFATPEAFAFIDAVLAFLT
jgi:pimeloyl-ACP methyl ester carboxylesterase